MGKKSSAPAFYGGNVSINGQNKASVHKSGNTIYSNYNMSDAERNIYNYAQNELSNNLKNINVFSKETKNDLKNQLDAYTNKGKEIINETYTPILNETKSDIASRFGNFDNSSFLNKLNSIENSRSNAINSLAQDVLAKKDELVNNELANRYQYLDYMNGLQNQINNNILSYLNAANVNSNNGTNYSATASGSNSGMGQYSQLASTLLSAASKFFTR
ncbi:hypothetical protein J6E39_00965 [bacterium]|nr:hypothetical protein [bacterium]